MQYKDMALYPKSITIDDAKLNKLTKTYEQAYIDIYNEISSATDFGIARRKIILAQIEQILKDLGVNTQEFIDENIPVYYKAGADMAVKQMQAIDMPLKIKTGFNRVHKASINMLVDDTASAFGESISGVNRSARALLSAVAKEALTQKLATGLTSGAALRKVQQQLVGQLKQEGLDALVDKGGNSWTLDRYTEMLIRTKFVEARNMGLKNRLVENDVDLVQVSSHGATDVCADWEGEILSLTGATTELEDGTPVATVADAEADGLFHPNCRHAINGLNMELAQQTMAWNADTGEYEVGLINQHSNYPIDNTIIT